jgi:glycosyltransferase involved in cell wall biosynthesis
MRVAFVSTMYSSPWGGSEELWSQAALRLKSERHAVLVSVVYRPTLSPRLDAFRRQGINVRTHSSRHFGLAGRVWHKVSRGEKRDFRHLSKHCPDLVVISQGDNNDGMSCLRYCLDNALPYVVIIQCNSETWWPRDNEARELAALYRGALRVFCVSRSNLELLERQIGEILTNGVVVRNPYNDSVRGKLHWPKENEVWRMACVARLDPANKGQDLLFQVLASDVWRDRNVEINLYGAGPCEFTLNRLAERLQLKNVHFRGHLDDIRQIWANNHLLILPSRIEGLPIALVESMWSGRPAIITDIAGNGELCIDGETGFLAAAPSIELLRQAMESAWNCRHNWQRMGEAARLRVEQLVPTDPASEFSKLLLSCVPHQSIEML